MEPNEEMLVKAICDATEEVFATMVPIPIQRGRIYEQKNSTQPSDGVVSLVGFAGSWAGTGGITCSATLACRLCSALLMMEASAVNEEVLDAVGEVANMIVGNFKTHIEAHVGPLMLSIPTVIYGRNFTARSLNNAEWTVVAFDCEGEVLEVKACLAPTPNAVHRGRANQTAALIA